MAKIKFGETPPIGVIYDGVLELEINDLKTKAVYTDDQTGATVVIKGAHLKANNDPNVFSGGSVEQVVLKDADGHVLITVKDGDFKAADLSAAIGDAGGFSILDAVYGGNDTIEGSSHNDRIEGYRGKDIISGLVGEDTIYGGRNDDVLTGGADSDIFVFDSQDGVADDRITDLDIKGGVTDYIDIGDLEIDNIDKVDGGKDTLITFENGATLHLDDVKKVDFLDYWNSLS